MSKTDSKPQSMRNIYCLFRQQTPASESHCLIPSGQIASICALSSAVTPSQHRSRQSRTNRKVRGRQSLRRLSDAEALPLRRNSKRFNSSCIICDLVLCDVGSAASHEYNGDYKNLMRLTKTSRSSSAHNQRHAVRAKICAD